MSHIIPRFFWKRTKEEGKYQILSANPNSPKKGQREPKEKLLCSHCDNVVLQKYETHFSKLIYGGYEVEAANTQQTLNLRNLDYNRMKKCILAILWRMHHSSLNEYKSVKLKKNHEEIIRKYLINEEAVPDTAFPIIAAAPILGKSGSGAGIMGPYLNDAYEQPTWHQMLQGIIFSVFLNEDFFHPKIKDIILKSNGTMVILKSDFMKFPFLAAFMKSYNQNNNL